MAGICVLQLAEVWWLIVRRGVISVGELHEHIALAWKLLQGGADLHMSPQSYLNWLKAVLAEYLCMHVIKHHE